MKQLRATLWMALLLGTLPHVAVAQAGQAPAGPRRVRSRGPRSWNRGWIRARAPRPRRQPHPPRTRQPRPQPRVRQRRRRRRTPRPRPRVPRPRAPRRRSASAGKAPAKKGTDRLELEATDVTGNSELPKVLYIVPWKPSELGDMAGRPVNSLLDEVLQPLDRDVFKRENRYYEALQPDEAAAKSDAAQGSGAKP